MAAILSEPGPRVHLPLARIVGASRLHRKINTTSMASGDRGRKNDALGRRIPTPTLSLTRGPVQLQLCSPLSAHHMGQVPPTQQKQLTFIGLLQSVLLALIPLLRLNQYN